MFPASNDGFVVFDLSKTELFSSNQLWSDVTEGAPQHPGQVPALGAVPRFRSGSGGVGREGEGGGEAEGQGQQHAVGLDRVLLLRLDDGGFRDQEQTIGAKGYQGADGGLSGGGRSIMDFTWIQINICGDSSSCKIL